MTTPFEDSVSSLHAEALKLMLLLHTTTACTHTHTLRNRITESQVTYVHASFSKGTNAAYASNNRSVSRGAYDGPPRPPPATIAGNTLFQHFYLIITLYCSSAVAVVRTRVVQ